MPSKSAKGKKDPCASAHSPPGLPWACRCRGCRPGRMPRSTRQRRCRSERGTAARHGQHRRGTAGAVWQWPHARAGRGRADRWPAGCRQATASSWQVGGPGGPAPHSLPAPPDCSPFCAGPPPPPSPAARHSLPATGSPPAMLTMHCSARVQPDMKGIASHSISMSICQSAAGGAAAHPGGHARAGQATRGDSADIPGAARAAGVEENPRPPVSRCTRNLDQASKRHPSPNPTGPASPSSERVKAAQSGLDGSE